MQKPPRMEKTFMAKTIPLIQIEFCADDVHRETENVNGMKNLPEEEEGNDKMPTINKKCLFTGSQVQGKSEDNVTSKDVFPPKSPRRKNGLGILTGYAGRPKSIVQRLSLGLVPEASLSSGPAKDSHSHRKSSNRFLTPHRNFHEEKSTPRLTVSPHETGLEGSGLGSCELQELKETTARLNLPTRRPSFVAWHDRYIKRPLSMSRTYTIHETEEDSLLSTEQRSRIDGNLAGIKADLMEMRSMDKNLAKNLLSLRREINKLKLELSCQEHEDLLEDAQDELEALQQLSEMCDYPLDEMNFAETLGPLKNIGVTRLNLSARRFSTC